MLVVLALFFLFVRSASPARAELQFSHHCTTPTLQEDRPARTKPSRTVDVFLLANSVENHEYIMNDRFWVVPVLMDQLAVVSAGKSDTRIHIFSDSDHILAKGRFMVGYKGYIGYNPT